MGEKEKRRVFKRPKNLRRETLNTKGLRLRIALIFIDVFYFVVGCVIMGIGARILEEKDNVLAIFGFKLMSSAAAVIIVAGAIICTVAMCGVAAVIIRNKPLMLTHIVTVTLILIMTITGGVLALVYRSEIGENVRHEMNRSLRDIYGVDTGQVNNAHITEVWDKLQTEHYCCGVEDNQWQIYRESQWFLEQPGITGVDVPYVPITCCVYNHHEEYLDTSKCQLWKQGPPGIQGGKPNEALHYRGCFHASGMLGLVWFYYVAGVSFGGAVVMMVGLILSVFFYRQLGSQD